MFRNSYLLVVLEEPCLAEWLALRVLRRILKKTIQLLWVTETVLTAMNTARCLRRAPPSMGAGPLVREFCSSAEAPPQNYTDASSMCMPIDVSVYIFQAV
jgi:hypothetical protein